MKYLKERNHSSLSRVAWLTDRGQGDGALSLGSRNIDRARDTDDMKGKVYSAISRRMAEQAGEFEYIYMQVKREMQKVDSWKSRQTPSNFGFTLSLPAKDTLIHFTCIHNMSPVNNQPPPSDVASGTSDTNTVGSDTTKEAPNVDDQDRERVRAGLVKLADNLRISWEMRVQLPWKSEGNSVTREKRKAWVGKCDEYLRKGAIEKYLGAALTNDLQPEIYLRELDEEDSHPLFLNDGRQAYQMVLTAKVWKRSQRFKEWLETVTVDIVLPSTLLPSGEEEQWTFSVNLYSLVQETDLANSNLSLRLLHPSSVDPRALIDALSGQVKSVVDTLEQQDISQTLSRLTL